jgi:hypothetical protein
LPFIELFIGVFGKKAKDFLVDRRDYVRIKHDIVSFIEYILIIMSKQAKYNIVLKEVVYSSADFIDFYMRV